MDNMDSNVWKYDAGQRTIQYKYYWIDLDCCRSSASVLDWIMQINKKTWATDRVLADLVRAFHHLLRPQANLCSGGFERGPIDVCHVLAGNDYHDTPQEEGV